MPVTSRPFSPCNSLCLLLFTAALFGVSLAFSAGDAQPPAKLELRPGDHISIIGNQLAELMQHDGWLEACLYSRFPALNLVCRNLGFAGDELTKQTRSANFGSTDAWLTKTQASVVFAFFGYNE